MPNFENGIMGLIPKEEWLDIGFIVERPNDPIDNLFGDERTNNLVAYWQTIAAEYQVPMMAQFHGFDTEAQTTFRVPVDTHNIEKGLIKVKINQSERMRALIRSGVNNNEMYDYVIRDGLRLAEQVITRTKVAKNEVMANGKVTIKENNLNLTVDYGVPTDQIDVSTGLDFSADSDIPGEIQKILDKAMKKGVSITGILTSNQNLTKMRNNTAIQKAINGNSGVGATVRRSALNDYLEDEFGINRVITNDLTYGADSKQDNKGNITITQKRYYPQDRITFFSPNSMGKMGVGLWGEPPEVDIAQFYSVNASTENPFVYIMQWSETDPAVLWTKACALFMPVLYNPHSLWISKITDGE